MFLGQTRSIPHPELNIQDLEGNSPLILAVKKNLLGIARLLLQSGAKLNQKNFVFKHLTFLPQLFLERTCPFTLRCYTRKHRDGRPSHRIPHKHQHPEQQGHYPTDDRRQEKQRQDPGHPDQKEGRPAVGGPGVEVGFGLPAE